MLSCNSIEFTFGQAAIQIGSQRDSFAAVAHCLAEPFWSATVDEEITLRFWAKVEKTDSCWNWCGGTRGEYGSFTLNGKSQSAHRVALFLSGVEIPPKMVCDHRCRNKLCVNPSHLRVVTHRINSIENSLGPTAINAQKTHCPKGHPYDAIDAKGGRFCRICLRAYQRHYYHTVEKARMREAAIGDDKGDCHK